MTLHQLAGKPAPESMLENIPELVSAYYTLDAAGPVSFGTSGHRGSALTGTFNEMHVAAMAQAICDFRSEKGRKGPLFMGFDTHALSIPAFRTALEVFAANGVETVIHEKDEYTPTPVVSFLIVAHNRDPENQLADGVVITPSHNPPRDGGVKYNPPHGGPADVAETRWIQDRANRLMGQDQNHIKRIVYQKACAASTTHREDFITPFVKALDQVVDMKAIREAGVRMGVDPMGGSGVHFWHVIAETYGLDMDIVNPRVDPAFGFMPLDGDGEIRMDCSSPYAMANLIALADRFDVAWGNDPDYDRHGIVCPTGLMNPNHYLSVAIWYLLQHRPLWRSGLKIGKTLVSSTMIDRVVKDMGRILYEVPVGFKWFVDGLLKGELAFGGEESAGASFLRMDGLAWCTDKDGFSAGLLSAEIIARTEKTPAEIYENILVPNHGAPFYKRADGPISPEQRQVLKDLTPESVKVSSVAGFPIASVATTAAGNGAPMGGVKVTLEGGSWFAVRPSGTEPKMKVYVESFGGEDLWERIYGEVNACIFCR
ncbi:MAG: alpha-D-glucose phosphate-specific phosphoglucomutase [Deltaproteobacteria bacterium]|jgi:phosphoglucomutase|nr:alpha-D-glucose phosphate-specific phosphoglucomutase [Deltaproteobacteria bacterium]